MKTEFTPTKARTVALSRGQMIVYETDLGEDEVANKNQSSSSTKLILSKT